MIRICSTSELPGENDVRDFKLPSGKMVCVANVHGRFHATDNVCPHQGAALGQGTVYQGKVICPWHGWQINPVTGVPAQDPTYAVERYGIEIVGEDVFVDL